jgi:hypothetical protein
MVDYSLRNSHVYSQRALPYLATLSGKSNNPHNPDPGRHKIVALLLVYGLINHKIMIFAQFSIVL